ncbi:autophagy-related protein 27 [Phascolomyces articulosus]|uniref:Autophagy-related protein 27 n=1 Tax=Phascolomyces articulosus TaxID=60185 RepID=A0AAD5KK31_9FUNG|nr:autophagy-related protein 27 [Phascolomyces articulosus]
MKLHLGLALIIGAATSTLGAQNYCNPNYKPVSDKDVVLDLSKLNRAFTISQKEDTPPSTTENEVQINICDELQVPEENKDDFCEKGTYICRRSIISRGEQHIVAQIQKIAGEYDKDKLNPAFKAVDTNQDLTQSGAKFSLVLNGGKYKDSTQSAQVTLECDASQDRNKDPEAPTLISYQNNVMSLNWKTVFACGTKEGEAPPPPSNGDNGNEEKSEGMSGAGVFFTIIGVVLAIYFVGGAFYNFKMYNARGLDLIPHRDFWLDLPYLIKDLISHLVDSIMSHRRGSGGYVSV